MFAPKSRSRRSRYIPKERASRKRHAPAILVDAPSAFGGHDSAPSPISYALASLVSCSQVTAQIVARELGIRLDAFTFDLSADLDTAAMVGGARDANPNFERVTVEATIRTDATPEQFAHLKAETERRCPVFALFSRSGIEISSDWRAVSANES
jgi:putative redox protein